MRHSVTHGAPSLGSTPLKSCPWRSVPRVLAYRQQPTGHVIGLWARWRQFCRTGSHGGCIWSTPFLASSVWLLSISFTPRPAVSVSRRWTPSLETKIAPKALANPTLFCVLAPQTASALVMAMTTASIQLVILVVVGEASSKVWLPGWWAVEARTLRRPAGDIRDLGKKKNEMNKNEWYPTINRFWIPRNYIYFLSEISCLWRVL